MLSTFVIVFASMIPWIWADGERISQATTVRSALVGGVPVQGLFDLLEAAQDARGLWRLDAVGRYEDLSVVRAAAGVRFDLKPDGLVILSSQRPQDFDLARECVDFIVSSSVDRQDEAIELIDAKLHSVEAEGFAPGKSSMVYGMVNLGSSDLIQEISTSSQYSLDDYVDISLLDASDAIEPSGMGIIDLYTAWSDEDRHPDEAVVCVIEVCMPPQMLSQILEVRLVSGGGDVFIGVYAGAAGDWIRTGFLALDTEPGMRQVVIPEAFGGSDGQKIVIQVKPGGTPPILESFTLRTSHELFQAPDATVAERAEHLMGIASQVAVAMARREVRPPKVITGEVHSRQASSALVIARLVFAIVFATFAASVMSLLLGFLSLIRSDFVEVQS